MSRKGGYQIIDFKGLRLEGDRISDKLLNLILKSDKVLLVSGLKYNTKLLPDCICSKRVLKHLDNSIPDTILLISNDKIFEIYGENNTLYYNETKFYNITPFIQFTNSVSYEIVGTTQESEITKVNIFLDDYLDEIDISNSLVQIRYDDTFVVTQNDISNSNRISFYLNGIFDPNDNPIDFTILQVYVQL